MKKQKYIFHHSAGGLLISSEGKIALLFQKPDLWMIPKGHLEINELPWMAALREVKEELGLENATVETYLWSEIYNFTLEENGPNHIKLADYYLLKTKQKNLYPSSKENYSKALWVTPQKAKRYVSFPGLKHLIKVYEKYLKRGKALDFDTASLSVGIPAKDPKFLKNMLISLRRELGMLGPKTQIQLIIASNQTSQKIKKLLDSLSFRTLRIKTQFITVNASLKAVFMNKIIAQSKNNLIIFLDDDILLQKGVVKECLMRIKKYPRVAIFSVNSYPMRQTDLSFYENLWHRILSLKFRKDVYQKPDPYLVGRFLIIPREKMIRLPENIINEDQYLQMFYSPYIKKFHDLNVYFHSVKNLTQHRKRVFRLEKGINQIKQLYPEKFLEKYDRKIKRKFDYKKIKALALTDKIHFYLYRLTKKFMLLLYHLMPKRLIKWKRI